IELQAVIEAFKLWSEEPLNVVSDSLYVVGVVRRMERSVLKHVSQEDLYQQLRTLWYLLEQRTDPCYITHIRSHTNLPGELSQGNIVADQLVAPVWAGPLPNRMGQASQSHQFFHRSAKALAKQFQISLMDAKGIVQVCPDCQQVGPVTVGAVNP
ncbi:POK18 protein, partial [Rhynochetos jubatus]|nr:POK18 protein [Rhynochetos jubatus]